MEAESRVAVLGARGGKWGMPVKAPRPATARLTAFWSSALQVLFPSQALPVSLVLSPGAGLFPPLASLLSALTGEPPVDPTVGTSSAPGTH